MLIDKSQKRATKSQTLIRRQDDKLGKKDPGCIWFFLGCASLFVFKNWSESHDFVIHIANEVAPVRVIIDEGDAINVELKESLEPAIYVFEVVGTPNNLDHFKSFGSYLADYGLVVARKLWFREDTNWSINGYIPFEVSYLLARKFEIFLVFILKYFYKLISICNQICLTKTNSQNVSDIIILLAVIAAAPVYIWS